MILPMILVGIVTLYLLEKYDPKPHALPAAPGVLPGGNHTVGPTVTPGAALPPDSAPTPFFFTNAQGIVQWTQDAQAAILSLFVTSDWFVAALDPIESRAVLASGATNTNIAFAPSAMDFLSSAMQAFDVYIDTNVMLSNVGSCLAAIVPPGTLPPRLTSDSPPVATSPADAAQIGPRYVLFAPAGTRMILIGDAPTLIRGS